MAKRLKVQSIQAEVLQDWLKLRVAPSLNISRYPCYQSKRNFSSHLILLDLLPSCISCLSSWSITCVSITAKMKVYYTVDTIEHNGPLFWLDVVERSLVKHISSAIMSHPAISIPIYLLPPPLVLLCALFVQPLTLFVPFSLLFFIIYPSC